LFKHSKIFEGLGGRFSVSGIWASKCILIPHNNKLQVSSLHCKFYAMTLGLMQQGQNTRSGPMGEWQKTPLVLVALENSHVHARHAR